MTDNGSVAPPPPEVPDLRDLVIEDLAGDLIRLRVAYSKLLAEVTLLRAAAGRLLEDEQTEEVAVE